MLSLAHQLLKMKKPFILIAALVACFTVARAQDYVKYVNTLQGTYSNYGLSYGSTFPTIGLPFAEHFYSPQTNKNGEGWKYQYQAGEIRGFEQVHQCSPWMGDYAVFSLMPVQGELKVTDDDRAASFKHENEIAKPSYYKVKFDNGMTAGVTVTERGAHMRFSFTGKADNYVVFDGYRGDCELQIIPEEHKIIGFVTNGTFIPKGFKNYFVIQFDQPFTTYGTWQKTDKLITKGEKTKSGKAIGAYLQFKKGAVVECKMASSYISADQAQLNFDTELKGFKTFDQTRAVATKIWNDVLGRVAVEGGTENEKATFYSCLFRANLFSRKFYDLDKEGKPYYYSPYDEKIHSGYMYTDNGFWDTFRAQFPLSNILHPEMEGRYMQSLLDAQQQYGFFPAWSNPGMSGVMLGNHAISLLADAWAKGIHTFDPNQALAAYLHEATNKGVWGGSNGREGWKDYFSLGYVPQGEVYEYGAKTLEYAYDDFCAYNLAKMTGNTFYQQIFARQMYNYKNLYDPKVGFMRGKLRNGDWLPDFDPIEWGGAFTEGNSWQYSWSVFQDVNGLVKLMGGEDKFAAKLDTFFTTNSDVKVGTYKQQIHEMTEMQLAKMGQYAHGNEPDMHVPYLYNYIGQPWKTQYRVRQIMDKLYNAGPKGFPGDEDQGQMSSWYVISALGLYSVCPGTDQYVIGSPVFGKATVSLENGKKFTVIADNNSKTNVYIQSETLNGKAYSANYITYAAIMNGGTLVLQMGAQPAKNRGVSVEDRPFSLSTQNK
jgi:predicted alpha-1,2-mannosidase